MIQLNIGIDGIRNLPHPNFYKKETATYMLRPATKPIHTDIIHRVQEEIQNDPRVFNDASWSIKAAWPHNQIGKPPVTPQGPRNLLHG